LASHDVASREPSTSPSTKESIKSIEKWRKQRKQNGFADDGQAPNVNFDRHNQAGLVEDKHTTYVESLLLLFVYV
jgi:hypothetical protein